MKRKIKSIYFSNRKEYYRRKKISSSLKEYHRQRLQREKIIKAQQEREEEKPTIYRQSVAFTSGNYGKTFRAELYTQYPNSNQEQRLKHYLEKRTKNSNKFKYAGYEQEEMSEREIKDIELNKLYFSVENN